MSVFDHNRYHLSTCRVLPPSPLSVMDRIVSKREEREGKAEERHAEVEVYLAPTVEPLHSQITGPICDEVTQSVPATGRQRIWKFVTQAESTWWRWLSGSLSDSPVAS